MTDVAPGTGSSGEQEGVDDDALADAILASYTSSIPLIRTPETPVDEHSAERVAAERISAEDRRLLEETASWTSYDPGAALPADGEDENAPHTVWDLGDLGGPAGFEGFDLPAPTDAEPIDLLSDPLPKPWQELPAPVPGTQEDDGENWSPTDRPVTPFDPHPFPVEEGGPWTRLVEQDRSAEAAPVLGPPDAADGWRPPAEWAPPVVEPPAAEPPVAEPLVAEPPVGGSGGTPTPWFDLSTAPPPSAPAAVPGPAPDSETDRYAGDAGYRDDEDGSVDESDRVSFAAAPSNAATPSAPPYAPLPSSEPAVYSDTAPRYVPARVPPRLPRIFEPESVGLEATPLDRRAAGAMRPFWLWLAPNASALSLGAGAVLFVTGMSLRQAIVAALGGVVLSFLPLGLGALAGKWSGQPTLVVSRASFGLLGNILPALTAVVSRVVWGGALLWLAGDALGAGLDRMTGGGGFPWSLVGVLAGAVLAGVVAVVGYGLLARVQLALSVLTAILVVAVVALTARRVDLGAALAASDGPWMLVASGVVLVFSFLGLAWVHSSADLARYQSPTGAGSATMLAASLGAGIPAFALVGWGAVLASSSPSFARALADSPLSAISSALPSWFPVPLLIGAVVASLAGAIVACYSGGFALQAVGLRLSRPVATVLAVLLAALVGAVFVLTGTDARGLLRDVLTTIAVPVAAWAGIFCAEVMIRNRRFHTPSLLERGGIYPDVRVVNLVALVLISALAFGFTTAQVPWLAWQGWFFWLLSIPAADPLAGTDIGVFFALALGLLVPLLSAIPAVRRQEAARV